MGLFPGLLLCLTVAAAARFLSEHYLAPQMLFALLLGMAFHFLAEEGKCVEGVEFSSKTVLRFGVALLGMRLTIDDVLSLGWAPVGVIISGVGATIIVGIFLSRLLGRRRRFGTLTGGAVAICGASAALAISSVLPKSKNSERDTIFTVIAVTALSTLAMILYPIVVSLLGLNDRFAGIFLGGTIHDVAQVVGAGYAVSSEAGDIATITKLLRVSLLVPIVLIISLCFKTRRAGASAEFPLPLFVIGFCFFVGLNSFQIVPVEIRDMLVQLSSWCLVMAIAALGIKTSLKDMLTIGYQPMLLITLETLFIAAWVLLGGAYLIG
ncbi:putative sulfate exporter family transporter [Sneathiella sp. CAU 1612]|uniref:Sulfate exporter family transporter n=1 Tax=Sneathiella sedimenti TaxID=2816034 RepID=A0ABS3F882_9PROT|nr:putative sulfate exporter family transporter [Sneathiella sedimenti]MBO0334732.1 putative sulfate exporter family transporter [Sneathiella sedimenti]